MYDYTEQRALRCLLYSLNDLECKLEKIMNQPLHHPVCLTRISRAEAAEFIGCSLRSLDRIVEDYLIPKKRMLVVTPPI